LKINLENKKRKRDFLSYEHCPIVSPSNTLVHHPFV